MVVFFFSSRVAMFSPFIVRGVFSKVLLTLCEVALLFSLSLFSLHGRKFLYVGPFSVLQFLLSEELSIFASPPTRILQWSGRGAPPPSSLFPIKQILPGFDLEDTGLSPHSRLNFFMFVPLRAFPSKSECPDFHPFGDWFPLTCALD